MANRVEAYLGGLKEELVRTERAVEQLGEEATAEARKLVTQQVTDIKAEIARIEAELGINKPKGRTPSATAERAVNTPNAERT